ncbi:hypothetical protein H2200_011733 [Cladophialophora chaetospira]|uniref:Rhodopsin domain-containing protein n=1 Tax=Cladophialophora chaetospira TaxID=386627 RepID=A0AA39CCU9_9EURO|nr:hypothetical protein H2200_011733 [Cladophialophora chaetospira]
MGDTSTADPTTAGNRYFRITDDDHRGVILVVSIICACYIPMILALRGTFNNKNIGLDDGLAVGVTSARWTAVAIIDGITEVLIFALSLAVILPLHMSKDRKTSAILTFAPRLAMVALTGLHARYIHDTVHSSNPGIEIVKPTVYRQVLLLFAIASAALPPLNRRLRNFNTSMGGAWMDTTLSQGSAKNTQDRATIPLKSLNKTKGSESRSRMRSHNRSQTGSKRGSGDEDRIDESKSNPSFRPDNVQHSTAAYWGKPVDTDAQSGQSQESQNSEAKIIRKDIQWRVHYENQAAPL